MGFGRFPWSATATVRPRKEARYVYATVVFYYRRFSVFVAVALFAVVYEVLRFTVESCRCKTICIHAKGFLGKVLPLKFIFFYFNRIIYVNSKFNHLNFKLTYFKNKQKI